MASEDTPASGAGHGTIEALALTKSLETAGIPCCICGVAALIYYGAARVKTDWEVCVPTDLLERAEALLRESDDYAAIPPPVQQPRSLIHTYPRFQRVGIRVSFILVPSHDAYIACQPSNFQRSSNDLPFPKLHILIQSFLEIGDRVSLCDVVDGSNVSYEWGSKNLELNGYTDAEWARKMNERIQQSQPTTRIGFFSVKEVEKETLWGWAVQSKAKRRGWTQPDNLFATRFRLHGSTDPWLEHRSCC